MERIRGGEEGNICNSLNNKDDAFLKGMKKNAECLLLVFAYELSIEWKIDINFFSFCTEIFNIYLLSSKQPN